MEIGGKMPDVVVSKAEDQTVVHNDGTANAIVLRGSQSGDCLTILRQTYPEGYSVPQHGHDHEDHAVYILAGRIDYLFEGGRAQLSAGDLIHIRNGAPHGFENVGRGSAEALVIFSPGGFDKVLDRLQAGENLDDIAGDAGLTSPER